MDYKLIVGTPGVSLSAHTRLVIDFQKRPAHARRGESRFLHDESKQEGCSGTLLAYQASTVQPTQTPPAHCLVIIGHRVRQEASERKLRQYLKWVGGCYRRGSNSRPPKKKRRIRVLAWQAWLTILLQTCRAPRVGPHSQGRSPMRPRRLARVTLVQRGP